MRLHSIFHSWAPYLLALLFSLLMIFPVSAQILVDTPLTGLPAGCHIATEADRNAGGTSIIVGVTSICPADIKAGITNDVGAAKDYLNSLPKRPLSQCAPPIKENIQALDNRFAICAAAFFKAYTARYGTVYITSAFRNNKPGSSPNCKGDPNCTESANQCAGGAPRSRHAKGLAIDVQPANEDLYPTMWKFASQNPEFGVCFPYQNHPMKGYPNGDRPHMTLAGIGGGEGSLCAAQGITKVCTAGSSFAPSYPETGGGTQTPTSSVRPPTRAPNGTLECPDDYILFNGKCFPYPEEFLPLGADGQACTLDVQMCPDGSYVGRTSPNCSFATCPVGGGQSYCQFGYVFVNGQCLPTQCNGSSAYAVNHCTQIPYQPFNQNDQRMPIQPGMGGMQQQQYPMQTQQRSMGASLIPGIYNQSTVPTNILDQLNQQNRLYMNTTTSTSSFALVNILDNHTTSNVPTNTPSDIIAQLNPSLMIGAHISNISTSAQQSHTSTYDLTIRSLTPTQTFTDNNPNGASYASTSTTQSSYVQTALAGVRSVLILILNYLQGLVR